MNFRSPSPDQSSKAMSPYIAAAVFAAAVVLALVPLSSSQQFAPPSWTVQSTDAAHSLLILRGSVRLGVDTGMFYVVQFRLQGNVNQLTSFQPNLSVVLESSGPKLQASPALGAKAGGKVQPQTNLGAKSPTASTVFTGIPKVGQTLLIQASGISPVQAVVVNVTGPQTYTAGQPGPPCCTVTAVNYQTSFQAMIASAKVSSGGQTFEFALPQPPTGTPPCDPVAGGPPCPSPVSVKVGQSVWANLATGQVSLDGKSPCCQIIAEGTSLSGAGGKPMPLRAKPAVSTTQACCEITSLNQQAKTASARVKSSGQTFQIAVSNPMLFQSLRVGQAIWANFKTRQVSLNGAGPVDGIQIVGGSIIAHGPGVTVAGKKPPYTAIPSPTSPPLTIHDHTLIMQAVFQNQAYLAQRISRHNWQHATPKQFTVGGMLYLLKSPSVSDASKERIRVAFQMLRKARLKAPSAADVAFLKEVSVALRTTNSPSAVKSLNPMQQKNFPSVIQVLNSLQQKYANQPRYVAALNLAKNLVNDGAATIYSKAWLQQQAQQQASGGVTPYADVLGCADINDVSQDCLDGGGGSPYPCPDPSNPACSGTCPDPNNPACSPDCGTDPTNPACNSCPDPNNPACGPDCTNDPTNPACGPDCTSDPTNPACLGDCPEPNNPNCPLIPPPPPPCPDPNNPVCTGEPDVEGCIEGAIAGVGASVITGETTGPVAAGAFCIAGGVALSTYAVGKAIINYYFGTTPQPTVQAAPVGAIGVKTPIVAQVPSRLSELITNLWVPLGEVVGVSHDQLSIRTLVVSSKSEGKNAPKLTYNHQGGTDQNLAGSGATDNGPTVTLNVKMADPAMPKQLPVRATTEPAVSSRAGSSGQQGGGRSMGVLLEPPQPPHIGQMVWVNRTSRQIRWLSFPFSMQQEDDLGDSRHLRTHITVSLPGSGSAQGSVKGTTDVWTFKEFGGFTGSVRVTFADDGSNILLSIAKGGGGDWHVCGHSDFLCGASGITRDWGASVQPDLLLPTAFVKIQHGGGGDTAWSDVVTDVMSICDAIGGCSTSSCSQAVPSTPSPHTADPCTSASGTN